MIDSLIFLKIHSNELFRLKIKTPPHNGFWYLVKVISRDGNSQFIDPPCKAIEGAKEHALEFIKKTLRSSSMKPSSGLSRYFDRIEKAIAFMSDTQNSLTSKGTMYKIAGIKIADYNIIVSGQGMMQARADLLSEGIALQNTGSDQPAARRRYPESHGSWDIITMGQGRYELVKIPSGAFMMGAAELEKGHYSWESPVHKVTVREFYLGIFPVTNEQYRNYLDTVKNAQLPPYPDDEKFNMPRQPVVGINWFDAQKFAEWMGCRLPSEAEWEYACRAGTMTRYYTGNSDQDLDPAGWYSKNSDARTHEVGKKEPNGFGLYDMHGNVWEWVEDTWHEDYNNAPADGTAWCDPSQDVARVFRGGSWLHAAGYCRSAFRIGDHPDRRLRSVGFRLAVDAQDHQ